MRTRFRQSCALSLLLLLFAVLTECSAAKPTGLSALLQLQKYTKISHDTYYLSRKRHPHNPAKYVHGYAFLNLHSSTLTNSPSANTIRRDKHNHFQRNLTTHESAKSHLHEKKLYANLPSCTGPIAEGASWKNSRGFYIHTQNRNGLTTAFIIDAIQKANDAWHCGTSEYEKLVEGPLLGVVDSSSGASIDVNSPDGTNQIGFASIEGHPGTVAVTIVWESLTGQFFSELLSNTT